MFSGQGRWLYIQDNGWLFVLDKYPWVGFDPNTGQLQSLSQNSSASRREESTSRDSGHHHHPSHSHPPCFVMDQDGVIQPLQEVSLLFPVSIGGFPPPFSPFLPLICRDMWKNCTPRGELTMVPRSVTSLRTLISSTLPFWEVSALLARVCHQHHVFHRGASRRLVEIRPTEPCPLQLATLAKPYRMRRLSTPKRMRNPPTCFAADPALTLPTYLLFGIPPFSLLVLLLLLLILLILIPLLTLWTTIVHPVHFPWLPSRSPSSSNRPTPRASPHQTLPKVRGSQSSRRVRRTAPH